MLVEKWLCTNERCSDSKVVQFMRLNVSLCPPYTSELLYVGSNAREGVDLPARASRLRE